MNILKPSWFAFPTGGWRELRIAKSCGYILILTLSVMIVISMLVLASMQELALYQKVAAQREKNHQEFYTLDYLVNHLSKMNHLMQQPCVAEQDLGNEVIQTLKAHKGCVFHFKHLDYHYLIEDLGEYPCIVVPYHKVLRATKHVRISLMSPDDTALIQVRVVYLSHACQCDDTIKEVHLGISSWRYLTI